MEILTQQEQQERNQLNARLSEPITQEHLTAVQLALDAAGVPKDVWLQLQDDALRFAATQFRNLGTLPTSLVLTTPFNAKSKEVRAKEEISHLYRSATMFPRSLLLLVPEEDNWWPMSRVLVCDTHELIYTSCIYTAVKRTGDTSLLRYLPRGNEVQRGPGRPRSEEVAQRKQMELQYKEQYFEWQARCRAIRAERALMEEEYERLKEQCKRLKQQMQELDAAIPPMPRK